MDNKVSTIPPLSHWQRVEPIKGGFTQDLKYKVTDHESHDYFLRISHKDKWFDLKEEAKLIDSLHNKGLPVAKVAGVGFCEDDTKSFLLLHWIEGTTLDAVLPEMQEKDQYLIGVKAGETLKQFHETSTNIDAFLHRSLIKKKMVELNAYLASDVRINNDQPVVDFILKHKNIMGAGPSVYEHSDFHPGNLILKPGNDIGIIDFNGSHPGDAYEEFYKLELFVIEMSQHYCIGQIHGYFGGEPPEDFWLSHSVYTAHAALYGLKWAQDHAHEDVRTLEANRTQRILADYDWFKRNTPAWYRSYQDMQKQWH